jgi:DnaA N-terminal domain
MSTWKADAFWKALQERVDTDTFYSWLRPLEFVALENNRLTFRVPNEDFVDIAFAQKARDNNAVLLEAAQVMDPKIRDVNVIIPRELPKKKPAKK